MYKRQELDSVTRITDDWVTATELESTVAEAKRVDQTFRFTSVDDDGNLVEITMADALDEIDKINAAVVAAKECNI